MWVAEGGLAVFDTGFLFCNLRVHSCDSCGSQAGQAFKPQHPSTDKPALCWCSLCVRVRAGVEQLASMQRTGS